MAKKSQKEIQKGVTDKSDEIRHYARYLQEVEGKTIPQIAKQVGCSERSISTWKVKDKWLKKSEKSDILQVYTQKNFLEQAAELGMDIKKAIGIHIDGMTKPIKTSYSRDGDLIEDDDYGTRHKYMKDFWTMAGVLGNNGNSGIQVGEGGIANIQIIHPGKAE